MTVGLIISVNKILCLTRQINNNELFISELYKFNDYQRGECNRLRNSREKFQQETQIINARRVNELIAEFESMHANSVVTEDEHRNTQARLDAYIKNDWTLAHTLSGKSSD